jgi:hypothetical protein
MHHFRGDAVNRVAVRHVGVTGSFASGNGWRTGSTGTLVPRSSACTAALRIVSGPALRQIRGRWVPICTARFSSPKTKASRLGQPASGATR